MAMAKVGVGSQWMRSDAAASFKRMVKDGMPTSGLVVAGRTMAKQRELYNAYKAGRGNLAAYPNQNAPHIKGVAFDASRGTPMQRWLVKGGAVNSRSNSEKIRANDYGFYRNVGGEAWHFRYFPEKDKHKPGGAKKPLASSGTVLKRGSRGEKVKKVQRKVGVKADGAYGAKTEAAVKKYQKSKGLVVDGKVGPKTLKKMGL